MVRAMRLLHLYSSAAAVISILGAEHTVVADVPYGPQTLPNPPQQPAPLSRPSTNIDNGQLTAGTAGTYQPIPPATLRPSTTVTDPVVPNDLITGRPAQPSACTPGAAPSGQGSIAHKQNVTIYPTFTRNASGGYDGSDPTFAYYDPNAIPPGGDPAQTQLGAPATANNIAGHLIGVPVIINGAAATPDGSCTNGSVTFGIAFLAGDDPPPPPSPDVRAAPPFATGPSLVAEISGQWRLGSIATLPGPGATARTYVHIPTCTWLDSTVPLSTTHLHALKTAQSGGYTFFLVYNVTVAPGTVSWDWGDGNQSTTFDAQETAPSMLPTYDPTSQTWSDPCAVSHAYATVSTGRTITASQAFSIDITVSWSDGVATHTEPVPCDAVTRAQCTLTVGPAQGWQSGPHPVDQIEPVPFAPQLGG